MLVSPISALHYKKAYHLQNKISPAMDKSPPASTPTVEYSRNTPHMKCTSMRARVHTHTPTHTYAQTQTTAQHKFSPLRTQALSTVDKESEIPKNSERTFHWKAQMEPTQHRCSHIQRLTVGTTVKKLSITRTTSHWDQNPVKHFFITWCELTFKSMSTQTHTKLLNHENPKQRSLTEHYPQNWHINAVSQWIYGLVW